ncbi:unnamed protein product [Phytophthora lilii]|uniref:Unnamed protein product n=1 Tax=Phytophthora lilii TaxID=2077276 RepID=A0A9W6UEV3_9STRA|nr:unnamed protein product [Phytophthora lilii]
MGREMLGLLQIASSNCCCVYNANKFASGIHCWFGYFISWDIKRASTCCAQQQLYYGHWIPSWYVPCISGLYRSTSSSTLTPILSNVSNVILTLDSASNPFAPNSRVIHSISPAGSKYGQLITSSPNELSFVPQQQGFRQELTVQLTNQLLQPLNLLDSDVTIKLLMRRKLRDKDVQANKYAELANRIGSRLDASSVKSSMNILVVAVANQSLNQLLKQYTQTTPSTPFGQDMKSKLSSKDFQQQFNSSLSEFLDVKPEATTNEVATQVAELIGGAGNEDKVVKELETLQAENSYLKLINGGLRTHNQGLNTDIEGLRAENTDLKTQLQQLTKVSGRKTNSLVLKRTSYEQQVAALQAEILGMRDHIQNLNRQIAALQVPPDVLPTEQPVEYEMPDAPTAERNMDGEGFKHIWNKIKSGYDWVKKHIIDTPVYQSVVKPVVREVVNSGATVLKTAVPEAASMIDAGVNKIGESTNAFGLKKGRISKTKRVETLKARGLYLS